MESTFEFYSRGRCFRYLTYLLFYFPSDPPCLLLSFFFLSLKKKKMKCGLFLVQKLANFQLCASSSKSDSDEDIDGVVATQDSSGSRIEDEDDEDGKTAARRARVWERKAVQKAKAHDLQLETGQVASHVQR